VYLLKIVIELMNCLFCKIANKEIPSEIIYEDGDTVGALDIQPRAPGHAMIIPKHHCENILDIPNEKIGAVFSAVRKITELLKEKLRPDGLQSASIMVGSAGKRLTIFTSTLFQDGQATAEGPCTAQSTTRRKFP